MIKKGVQVKQKLYFFFLLFLILLSWQQSTVNAPEGAAGLWPLGICDIMVQVFKNADLKPCGKQTEGGVPVADFSRFEDASPECKTPFYPSDKLSDALDNGPMSLKAVKNFKVDEDTKSHKMVISVSGDKDFGKINEFYRTLKFSDPVELFPHTTGALDGCLHNKDWRALKMEKFLGKQTRLVDSNGDVQSILFDAPFILQGWPGMVKSIPWKLKSIVYEDGQFHIVTEAGDEFSTKKVVLEHFPHKYFEAVARELMKTKGAFIFYYVPSTAQGYVFRKRTSLLSGPAKKIRKK